MMWKTTGNKYRQLNMKITTDGLHRNSALLQCLPLGKDSYVLVEHETKQAQECPYQDLGVDGGRDDDKDSGQVEGAREEEKS